ncbi:MAG: DUF6285 domain-containing protein [bacterium]
MTMNRPSKEEIVKAVTDYLKDEVAPKLTGRPRFQVLIAASLLEIVLRELSLDPRSFFEPEELDRLVAPEAPPDASLAEKEALLCRKIRDGAFDAAGPARERLLAYLAGETRYKIQVDNPKW